MNVCKLLVYIHINVVEYQIFYLTKKLSSFKYPVL